MYGPIKNGIFYLSNKNIKDKLQKMGSRLGNSNIEASIERKNFLGTLRINNLFYNLEFLEKKY